MDETNQGTTKREQFNQHLEKHGCFLLRQKYICFVDVLVPLTIPSSSRAKAGCLSHHSHGRSFYNKQSSEISGPGFKVNAKKTKDSSRHCRCLTHDPLDAHCEPCDTRIPEAFVRLGKMTGWVHGKQGGLESYCNTAFIQKLLSPNDCVDG